MMSENRNGNLHEGIWKIERYGVYEINGWCEKDFKDCRTYLILKNLTLMLMKNDTMMELIPLAPNVRAVLKKDSLGLAVTYDEKKMRKIRLKFASTHAFSGVLVAKSCATMLKKYIQMEDLNPQDVFARASSSNNNNLSVCLAQHVSELMTKSLTEFYMGDMDFSSVYPLEDIIDICILDEKFPSFVAEVNEILLKKLKKN